VPPDSIAAPPGRAARLFWPVLGIVLLLALVLRIVLLYDYWTHSPLATHPVSHALEYWQWAGRVAAGQWLGKEPFFSAPLYPYCLGILRALGGGLLAVYVLQIVGDVAVAGLLALLGRARFGPLVGLIAAAVWALMLEPASFALRVLPATMQALVLACLWLVLVQKGAPFTLRRAALVGILTGLVALNFSPAMVAVPVLAAWVWWQGGRSAKAVRSGTLVLVTGIATILPATLHNYAACGEFIPISAQAGVTFAQGNLPGSTGTYTLLPGIATSRDVQNADTMRVYRLDTGAPASWNGVNRYFLARGLELWRTQPCRAVRLALLKGYWFLSARHYSDIYQPTVERVEGLTKSLYLFPIHTAWLIPIALLAGLRLVRRPFAYLPELLLLALPLLIVLAFFYSPRYRFPAVPVAVVLAAWQLAELVAWRRARIAAAVAASAVLLGLLTGPLNTLLGFDTLAERRGIYWCQYAESLRMGGRAKEAMAAFDRGLQFWPQNATGLANSGRGLFLLGDIKGALARLQQAAKLQPEDAQTRADIGKILAGLGRMAEARAITAEAARLNPYSSEYHRLLAGICCAMNDIPAGITALRRAHELLPADVDVTNDLAWYLASTADRPAEDRAEALRLADGLVTGTHAEDPGLLDTLAVACAATGDFARAIATAERAIALATAGGKSDLTEKIGARLKLYRQGQAYVIPIAQPAEQERRSGP